MPKLQVASLHRTTAAVGSPRLRVQQGTRVRRSGIGGSCLSTPTSLLYGNEHVFQYVRRTSSGVNIKSASFTASSTNSNDDATQNRADQQTRSHSKTQTPPPQGALSIVFTDIVKSTALWESHPQAMTAAMHTHDAALRDLTLRSGGYEVKQNGDGFMLAFSTALAALRFCLAAQRQLLDLDWPTTLLERAPASREIHDQKDDEVIFRGLCLRMSVHWGTPITNWNPVAGRMDYLGPTVNRAARFIQVCEGGQIVISADFLNQLQSSSSLETKAEREEFEIRSLGKHRFKGLDDPEELFFVVPKSLKRRLEYWPRHQHVVGSKGNIASPESGSGTGTGSR